MLKFKIFKYLSRWRSDFGTKNTKDTFKLNMVS